jgi:hypothetical protein
MWRVTVHPIIKDVRKWRRWAKNWHAPEEESVRSLIKKSKQ